MQPSFDKDYTPFEQSLAVAWAQAHLTEYLVAHPNAEYDEKYKTFSNAFELGLSFALEFSQNFS